MHGTLDFDPLPGGTRMRWAWDVRPQGLLRLMIPVIVCIGRRQERTVWTGLKRVLESRDPTPSSIA
jgi:hypothetical protein